MSEIPQDRLFFVPAQAVSILLDKDLKAGERRNVQCFWEYEVKVGGVATGRFAGAISVVTVEALRDVESSTMKIIAQKLGGRRHYI